MEFISLGGKDFNTIHANDFSFFEDLDAVIQREPLGVIDDEMRGLLASIGIVKGTPFVPDARMRALLTDAVAVANGTARAISFKTRDPEAYRYPNRRWKTAFIGDDYRRLLGNGHCTRPVSLDCNFETICERCGFFETGPQFVEIIQRQHDHAAGNNQHDRAQLFAELLDDIDNTS